MILEYSTSGDPLPSLIKKNAKIRWCRSCLLIPEEKEGMVEREKRED